jgi:primosomal protein N'
MYATRGAIERFYDDEISLREMMGYPPYSTFVLLTWLGSTEVAKNIEAKLSELLPKININFYNSPTGSGDKTDRNALIRLGGSEAELSEVLYVIKKLPPYIKIQINPDRIV